MKMSELAALEPSGIFTPRCISGIYFFVMKLFTMNFSARSVVFR